MCLHSTLIQRIKIGHQESEISEISRKSKSNKLYFYKPEQKVKLKFLNHEEKMFESMRPA